MDDSKDYVGCIFLVKKTRPAGRIIRWFQKKFLNLGDSDEYTHIGIIAPDGKAFEAMPWGVAYRDFHYFDNNEVYPILKIIRPINMPSDEELWKFMTKHKGKMYSFIQILGIPLFRWMLHTSFTRVKKVLNWILRTKLFSAGEICTENVHEYLTESVGDMEAVALNKNFLTVSELDKYLDPSKDYDVAYDQL